jgi:tRNA-modifying protein YgfZ
MLSASRLERPNQLSIDTQRLMQSWVSFLNAQGARFDAGRVLDFGDASHAKLAVCDLSHYGLIRVTGVDAASFLQAQLTNDVNALEDGDWQLTGWCTPKGRLLVTFVLWRWQNEYWLMLPRDLQAGVQKRLGMFVLRAKVVLTDASDLFVRIGVVSLDDADAASNQGAASRKLSFADDTLNIPLSARRALLLAPTEKAEAVWQRVSRTHAPRGANAWDLALIYDGVLEVRVPTQEQFVPQMANFDLTQAVSFKKGCYPGQEIVARTQYRGILKRRSTRVITSRSTSLSVGSDVYSPLFPDQAIGMAALVAHDNDGVHALVATQIEAIRADTLYSRPDCDEAARLRVAALPYIVPEFV